jgi:uncharacterized protein
VKGDLELQRGLDLMREGRFFEAHEVLEIAWRDAEPADRDFFQGLVHVTVAWYQAGRGRPVACASQLRKARRRLGAYVPAHAGVDVVHVLEQVASAEGLLAAGSLDLPAVRV